jgi:NADPH:quinone reductase-like Zn-dependent oxidoreductase
MATADAAVPATMKAMVYVSGGGMKLDASAPVPNPTKTQVLVKVHSAGLNPVRARGARRLRTP